MKQDKTQERRETKNALLQLLKEAKSIRWQLALGCLLSVLLIGCAIAAPKLVGSLVQVLIDYFPIRETAGYAVTDIILPGLLVLLAIYAAKGLISYFKMLLLNKAVSRYFTCTIRIKLSDKIQRLPVRYVDNTPVGDILSRMTDDVSHIGNSLHEVIDTIMGGFLQIAAITVMLLLEHLSHIHI